MLPGTRFRRIDRRLVLLAALVCSNGFARADRGGIRTEPINIEEPAQRAIIAHNGVREWIFLQTEVRAEKATKVVEFMPLPAKPRVSLAPEGCFAALRDLLERHNFRYHVASSGARAEMGAAGDAPELVKVVVSAQLGPHAVTVAEVQDTDAFVAWVRDFFRQNDLGEPALTPELREVVAGYLARDVRFFAFDVLTVSPEQQTVQPLTYEFRSDHLYYPLVVTNLYGGTGAVELFTILPRHVSVANQNGPGKAGRGRLDIRPHRDVENERWRFLRAIGTRGDELTSAELAGLHPELPDWLGSRTLRLEVCKYEGPLRFERDVNERLGYPLPSYVAERFIAALAAGDSDVLDSLIATPFALGGRTVIASRRQLLVDLLDTKLSHAAAEDIERGHLGERGLRFDEVTDRLTREFIKDNFREKDQVIQMVCRHAPDRFVILVRHVGYGFYRVVGFTAKR